MITNVAAVEKPLNQENVYGDWMEETSVALHVPRKNVEITTSKALESSTIRMIKYYTQQLRLVWKGGDSR